MIENFQIHAKELIFVLWQKIFFVTLPHEFEEAERLNFFFGLRQLKSAHDEEVVPEIGNVYFVRQASWALSALYLLKDESLEDLDSLREKVRTPAILANAIEALAQKLLFLSDKENYRDKGVLAFKRYGSRDAWTFDELKNPKNYVRTTYRQSTVSALKSMGFCEGTRFNRMKMRTLGKNLAKSFLEDQDKNVKNIIKDWVCKSTKLNNLKIVHLFERYSPSDNEKKIFAQTLNSRVHGNDADKRRRIISYLKMSDNGQTSDFSSLVEFLNTQGTMGKLHVEQLYNAINFDKVRCSVHDLYAECMAFMQNVSSRGYALKSLCKEEQIKNKYEMLKVAMENYRAKDSLPKIAFKNPLVQGAYKTIDSCISYLIREEGRVLALDGDTVIKGQSLKEENNQLPKEIETNNSRKLWHSKLEQLKTLWGDACE